MIHSIKCNKPSFNTINFKKGFNVILAERTKESTRKDSRNGLGKSTLIEIIHFCLGGNKGETLRKPELNDWTFTMDFDLSGKRYSISRNTKNPNKIIIDGDCSAWPIKPNTENKDGLQLLSKKDWTNVLGILVFGVKPIFHEHNYRPTFRSLISYFIRKNGQSGAFLNPFQNFKAQKEWDIQIANCFLLGLGWEYASKWQVLKDRTSVLKQLQQEATTGIISNLVGNIGELEARKITLEAQVKRQKDNLDSFRVHPQYRDIEEDANGITKTIHDKINQVIDEKRLLEHYEECLKEEVDAAPEKIKQIYNEAGKVFLDKATKEIEDVVKFHKQIVLNRREFLGSEIERVRHRTAVTEQEIQSLTTRRADLMVTLKTHGALQEFMQLQTNHQSVVAELNDVSIRLDNLKNFEQGKSAISVEQELLQQQANNDLNERMAQKQAAILTFNSYSETLYKTSGTLSINTTKTGFKFKVDIQRSGSHGIGNMKIFCYDLMLAKLWANRATTLPFLIHDSILFADVDERQKALALQLAESESRNEGFQYICTMNSDSVPTKDFDKDFNFSKFVVKTLRDASDEEGLLGVRF